MKNSQNCKKELTHIGPIIRSLLSSYQVPGSSSIGKLNRIADVWAVVAGNAIADNTKPHAVKGKLLYVNVTSSVWIQQLQYIKKDLVVRLNAALGEEDIDKIKFKIGSV